jgi:hypothetical protein
MMALVSQRKRSPQFCVALGALALAVAACGGGGGKHAGTSTTTKPKVLAIKTAILKVGKVDVESAGPPNAKIDPPTGRAVMTIAQKYIDNAVFAPLQKGTLGAEYAKLFDPGVKPLAISADRNALTDLSVGKATNLSTKATPVLLSALAGSLGELTYVATNFDLTVKGTIGTQKLGITRHIEFTFAKTGKNWLVTAYRVQTIRKSVAGTTTTTATAGSTKP